jgi:hypothetical protein
MDGTETKQQAGRPKGAKTVDRASTISLPPSCPTCGSTRREPYRNGVVCDRREAGEICGRPYNRILWRRTRCLDCGQNLIVREYLYEPSEPAEK